jgi:hypothetical protein
MFIIHTGSCPLWDWIVIGSVNPSEFVRQSGVRAQNQRTIIKFGFEDLETTREGKEEYSKENGTVDRTKRRP